MYPNAMPKTPNNADPCDWGREQSAGERTRADEGLSCLMVRGQLPKVIVVIFLLLMGHMEVTVWPCSVNSVSSVCTLFLLNVL